MKMSFAKQLLFNSVFLLAALAIGYFLGYDNSQRIAVVRSADLIMNNAMIEAEFKQWKNFESEWKSRVLTLEQELEKQIKQLDEDLPGLTDNEQLQRRRQVEAKRQEYISYAKNAQAQSQENESKIMNAVLERINVVAKQYGDEHGFDVILGSNGDGNVLYGKHAVDITDDLLAALDNEFYDRD